MKSISPLRWLAMLPLFIPLIVCPQVSVTNVDETATFTVSGLDALSDDPNFVHPPHYQVFTMMGDGNFYWNSHEIDPSGSYVYYHPYFPYQSSALVYDPVVLLIERKTDDPPPSSNMVIPTGTISIPSVSSSPADFIHFPDSTHPAIIDAADFECRRVGLKHSHYLEDTSWSAFILAHQPEKDGVLLFFFDQNAGPPLFADNPATYGPRYGNVDLPDVAVSEAASVYGTGQYAKVLRYDIKSANLAIDNLSDGREEQRIFHYLLSRDSIEKITTPSTYMVILAATRQATNCSSPNFEQDSSFVSGYVNPDDLTISNGSQTYYFVDADTIQLKHGDPKDPNSLVVTDICKCSNGKYRVSFLLTFCNISPVPTKSASLFIHDLAGKFSCFQSNGTEKGYDPNVENNGWNTCSAANNKCAVYDFSSGSEAKFCVGGYEIWLDDETKLNGGDCVSFGFSAETDEAGLQSLLQDGALKACVNFHETQCELVCSYSEKLDTSLQKPVFGDLTYNAILQAKDTSCVSPCPKCKTRPPVILIALAVVAILIGFYFFRKRKKMPNVPIE